MFEVYIDSGFLREAYALNREDEHLLKEFFNAVANRVLFVFDLNSEEDLMKDEELDLLVQSLLQLGERSMKTAYDPKATGKIISGEKYRGLKLFFVGKATKESCKDSENSGYVHISPSEVSLKLTPFLNAIKKDHGRFFLSLGRKNDIAIKNKGCEEDFQSTDYAFNTWEDLNYIGKVASNSVVIVDPYLLKTPLHSQDLVEAKNRINENLLPLLKAILPSGYSGEFDLVIISLIEDFKEKARKDEPRIPKAKKAEMLRDHIKGLLTPLTATFKSLKIAIVHLNNNFSDVQLHDRLVYTNYFRLHFTSGLDLSRKGQITRINSEVNVDCVFKDVMLATMPCQLGDLRQYLENAVKNKKSVPRHPETFGNRLLNFRSNTVVH